VKLSNAYSSQHKLYFPVSLYGLRIHRVNQEAFEQAFGGIVPWGLSRTRRRILSFRLWVSYLSWVWACRLHFFLYSPVDLTRLGFSLGLCRHLGSSPESSWIYPLGFWQIGSASADFSVGITDYKGPFLVAPALTVCSFITAYLSKELRQTDEKEVEPTPKPHIKEVLPSLRIGD
jgi:hypothetical protein